MESTRRTFLSLFGTGLTIGLAGCSGQETQQTSLSISNFTESTQSLFIEILPEDIKENHSENYFFAEWIDLGEHGIDDSYKEFEEVFPTEKALVRVRNSQGYLTEYTFIPDCPSSETGEHVEVTLQEENAVTVSQNWCRTS